MSKKKIQGFLLDVGYAQQGKDSVIKLQVKTEKGMQEFFDEGFKPYFYAIVKGKPEEAKKRLLEEKFSDFEIRGIEIVERKQALGGRKEEVLRIEFPSTRDLVVARNKLQEKESVKELREYKLPFARRYLIDRDLQPLSGIELILNKDEKIKQVKRIKENKELKLNVSCFDLETLSPERMSNPEKDPIIMGSVVGKKGGKVFCEKEIGKRFVEKVRDEKELVKKLVEEINASEVDVVGTYNGDLFDLPYLKVRGEKLEEKVPKITLRKKGLEHAAFVEGKQHVDAYQIVRLLNRLGVVNLVKMDLEAVNEAIFGEKKEKIFSEEINEIWKQGKGKELERLAEYNKEDSEVTYKIIRNYLHLFVELGKLVKMNLFDVTRAASSMLVESLLVIKSFQEGILIPREPDERTVKQRMMQTYVGGFVKEPVRGLHENIAVLDFSSLHPTIMISHSISPDTLDCGHAECKRKNMAPTKHHFCVKEKGFLSSILKELYEKRMEIKKGMKGLDKKGMKYKAMDAEQFSLKILLNSFYGTLGYPRFKWYARECASAVTALSRGYVKMVGEKAGKKGFEWVYADTDSALLKIPKEKSQEDVKKFVEGINKELPGVMNLELEGFFRRGIFVTKKGAEEAAKKRYALIDFKGNLKIVGFEYVRRDWARIAKETQRKVIKSILEEGKPEKAVRVVRNVVNKLREGRVKKQELVIYTQVKRALAKYEAIGPHVAAAKKAVQRGKEIEVGSVIDYIVTKNGKSISDKAQLAEYVKEGNYDAEYYIRHQIIPAVIKIIGEFGLSEEDLIHGGKQKTLGAFG